MNVIFFLAYGLLLWALCVLDLIKVDKGLRKIVAYAIILSFSVFAAFRGMAVSDTVAYSEYFIEINKNMTAASFFAIDGRFEIGYEFLTKIIALITNSTRIYFFIIAFINISLAYNIFCDKKYIILPLVVYISFFGFYFGFVILRAGLSILFFCYGVLRCRKNFIKLLFSFILALAFHNSAIVAVVLYFICRLGKRNISFSFSLLLIAISFSFYVSEIFIKVLNMGAIKFLMSLNINNKIWLKGLGFLQELVPSGQIIIAKRFVFNIIIYLGTKYVISKSPSLKKEKLLLIIDRLLIFAFIMIGILGNGTLIGRLSDYLFIFNIIYLKLTFNEYQKYRYMVNIRNNMGETAECGAIVITLSLMCIILLNLAFVYRLLILPI